MEEHAEVFLQGRIRVGLLQTYRQIEDACRRDELEGAGSVYVPENLINIEVDTERLRAVRSFTEPGHLHVQSTHVHPIYACCCSFPPGYDLNKLPTKFGKIAVQINDPRVFGQNLTDAVFVDSRDSIALFFRCVRVSYTKDESLDTKLSPEEHDQLSYGQKSVGFADEHEYRLVMVDNYSPCPSAHKWVQTAKPLDYAKIIYL